MTDFDPLRTLASNPFRPIPAIRRTEQVGQMRIGFATVMAMILVGCSASDQATNEIANSPPNVFERITAQEAAKRVAQCGLGPVTTRYDADLDEDLLVVTDIKSPSDDELACADKAVSFYTLKLPPSVQPRYDAMREARLGGLFKDQARARLSAKGLLKRVPAYREGITNEALFAQQVEALCGPRAKGAFQSKFGFHAISPEWAQRNLNPLDEGSDVLTCLMDVTTVAGFKLGFIGNEYYRR